MHRQLPCPVFFLTPLVTKTYKTLSQEPPAKIRQTLILRFFYICFFSCCPGRCRSSPRWRNNDIYSHEQFGTQFGSRPNVYKKIRHRVDSLRSGIRRNNNLDRSSGRPTRISTVAFGNHPSPSFPFSLPPPSALCPLPFPPSLPFPSPPPHDPLKLRISPRAFD